MQEVVHPPVSLKMASRRKICCRHHWINNCCSMFHGSSVAISWCPGSQQPRRLETAEARITGSSSEEVLVICCRIISSRWCHHSDCRLNDLSWYKSKTVSCNCSLPFAKAKRHIIIMDYKKILFLIAMQEKQTVPNDICSVASTSALSPPPFFTNLRCLSSFVGNRNNKNGRSPPSLKRKLFALFAPFFWLLFHAVVDMFIGGVKNDASFINFRWIYTLYLDKNQVV